MARRFDSKESVPGKSRTQSKDERQQARAAAGTRTKAGRGKAGGTKAAGGKAGGTKAGGAKAGREKTGAKAAARSENDRAIEQRLQRLEQELALQAERSEELLEKVETVIAGSGGNLAGEADDEAAERDDD